MSNPHLTRTQRKIVDHLSDKPEGVTSSELIAIIWQSRPPNNPGPSLHWHILKLREALAMGGDAMSIDYVLFPATGHYVLHRGSYKLEGSRALPRRVTR